MRPSGSPSYWEFTPTGRCEPLNCPKPSLKVVRVTKTNHSILQGVVAPDARLIQDKRDQYTERTTFNAHQRWLSRGGPLAEHGADYMVIGDPQMPH